MVVNRRLLLGSLTAAVVFSGVGGYLLNRAGSGDATPGGDDVTLTSSGLYDAPGIPLNDKVRGAMLAAFTVTDTNGNEVHSSDLIGAPLVINLWATTCEPCKRELPAFAAAHRDLGDQIRFVGINQFINDDTALNFARQYGVGYEMLADVNGEFVLALGVSALPYTLFVAADGTIIAQKGTEISAAELRSNLDLLLEST